MIWNMRMNAYAKLNWTLDVLFAREDGYHELDMLMQSIDVFDVVELAPAQAGVHIVCDTALPADNTALKAAQLYFERAGINEGIRIRIQKNIPEQSGMGGGSADAAAVLKGLDALYGALTDDALFEVALRVGADVPFCLLGGSARARGLGEWLTRVQLPESFEPWLLVVKPREGISTAELFKSLRRYDAHPDTEGALEALRTGELNALAQTLGNSLMVPAQQWLPQIRRIRRAMCDAGALGACMTGSGSAVYGVFETESAARQAVDAFEDFPFRRVCTIKHTGIERV